ncbi:MAG: 3-phosphoshikimate 1-carboxyvinyltransferase [Sphingobacteriaceae bacterium]|nr:3-phosphoshikimate 1-carboxyvinyltransferase [Sphingobacteriaceae bacterium]
MNLKLHKPINSVSGTINLPGSKSISNRILIIKALSGLDFLIQNLSDSDDTKHLKEAIGNYSTYSIINVGHAGTDMRFLTAFLSIKNGDYELTGSERLQQRPIKDLVDVLKTLGADIYYKNNEGFPPLQINGKQLQGGAVEISGKISSQFITALLLVAPYFNKGLELTIKDELVSKPYVHMTIELMKEFGASVIWKDNKIIVEPIPYTYHKKEFIVESDWSAASYYYSMVALSKIGTQLSIKGLFENSLQADDVCSSIYKNFGVKTTFNDNEIVISKNSKANTSLLELDFIECPDITQTIICSCIGLNVPFKFTGLQTLKVKETDRITALQNELQKIGCAIEITDTSIQWTATKSEAIDNLSVATYNDHRMAMSFAPLCLLVDNVIVENAEVVSKSYPMFWEHLKSIGINQTQL